MLSPSAGWAKFKGNDRLESRDPPLQVGDLAQPIGQNWRNGPHGRGRGQRRQQVRVDRGEEPKLTSYFQGRGGFRRDGLPPPPNPPPTAGPPVGPPLGNNFMPGHGPGSGPGNHAANESMQFLQQMNNLDPKVVETEIIPQIINQARSGLENGNLNHDQFSELMKQVMVLKEQALMRQADMRQMHQNNRRGGPRGRGGNAGPRGPWDMLSSVGPMGPPPMGFTAPPMGPPQPPPPGMRPPFGDAPQAHQPPFRPRNPGDLPPSSEDELHMIEHDPIRSINIDKQMSDILFYGETAVFVNEDNQPRELIFERPKEGPTTRRVLVDGDPDVIPPLEIDNSGEYSDFSIDGVLHKIRIGAPTRELWIDGEWYECFFGETVNVRFGEHFRALTLEGPSPAVHKGRPRPDLCAGFVHLIMQGDINNRRRLYLDTKPQRVDICDTPVILRFVDNFEMLLINGHPYKVDFGGCPLIVQINGERHFLRISTLPKGVKQGVPMEALKEEEKEDQQATEPSSSSIGQVDPPQEASENSQDRFDSEGHSSAFDKLLSLFPKNEGASKDTENPSKADYAMGDHKDGENADVKPATAPATPSVDVHNLFEKLLGAGLVGSSEANKKSAIPGLEVHQSPEVRHKKGKESGQLTRVKDEEDKENEAEAKPALPTVNVESAKPIVLQTRHPSLKERQMAVVNELYDPSALQCKICGLRFPCNDIKAYSQHLDWHFRMKRREKEAAKKAQSRKWFFPKDDWIISEEIEDIDEEEAEDREKVGEEDVELPCVAVEEYALVDGEKPVCPVCKEEFEEFFKDGEYEDRWFYRNAVCPDNQPEGRKQLYHSQCYQDYKAEESTTAASEDMDTSNVAYNDQNEEAAEAPVGTSTPVKEEPSDESMEQVEIGERLIKVESEEKPEGVQVKEEKDDAAKSSPKAEDNQAVETPEAAVKEEEELEADDGENKEAEDVKEDSKNDKEEGDDGDKEDEVDDDEKKREELQRENSLTLDDHHEMQATPAPAAKANITINITSQVDKVQRSESVISNASFSEVKEEDSVEDEFDYEAVKQAPSRPDWLDAKPHTKGRRFTEFPAARKDSDVSGLCSIM